MPDEPTQPAAPVVASTPPAAGEPPAGEGTAAPAAQVDPQAETKRQRNLNAQRGRELAEANRKAAEASQLALQQAQQVQALSGQVQQLTNYLVTREQEAQLMQIEDPGERADARARLMQQQVTAMQSRPAPVAQPPAPPRESEAQYKERRVNEIIAVYNRDFGLTGENAITIDDDIDDSSEGAFLASVARVAEQRAQGGNMPAKKAAASEPQSREDLKKEVMAELRREMNIGGPQAAPAAASRPGGVTTAEDFQNVVAHEGYVTPKQRIAALRGIEVKAPTPA